MIRTLMLCAALGLSATTACAQSETPEMTKAAPIGLADGTVVPPLSLVGADGQAVDLSALAGSKGTALVFVRSADWCPYCKRQLMELEAARQPLADAGWTLAAVSYDSPETLAAFKAEKGLSFPLLSDAGSKTIRAFHLLNTDMKEGTRFFGIPHPAIVLIGADGTVRQTLREEGYKERPAIDVLIEAAKAH